MPETVDEEWSPWQRVVHGLCGVLRTGGLLVMAVALVVKVLAAGDAWRLTVLAGAAPLLAANLLDEAVCRSAYVSSWLRVRAGRHPWWFALLTAVHGLGLLAVVWLMVRLSG